MDQIDLAPLTLPFLARVQLLRESTQLFRCAPQLLPDTSYFLSLGQDRCPNDQARAETEMLGFDSPRRRKNLLGFLHDSERQPAL
jgi:hypothetical protein